MSINKRSMDDSTKLSIVTKSSIFALKKGEIEAK